MFFPSFWWKILSSSTYLSHPWIGWWILLICVHQCTRCLSKCGLCAGQQTSLVIWASHRWAWGHAMPLSVLFFFLSQNQISQEQELVCDSVGDIFTGWWGAVLLSSPPSCSKVWCPIHPSWWMTIPRMRRQQSWGHTKRNQRPFLHWRTKPLGYIHYVPILQCHIEVPLVDCFS